MKDRVIEPSEIIVEQVESPFKENITHANPWIRLVARFFDYSLFFSLLSAVRYLLQGKVQLSQYEYFIPFEFFVWIPFETALLATIGTTPGKWFLRTKLKPHKHPKLKFEEALQRSFAVWLRGLGLGIPVLNFFCLLTAYNKLKIFQVTSWDKEAHITVTHYPIGRWRLYLAVFVAIVGILHYYSSKKLGV